MDNHSDGRTPLERSQIVASGLAELFNLTQYHFQTPVWRMAQLEEAMRSVLEKQQRLRRGYSDEVKPN